MSRTARSLPTHAMLVFSAIAMSAGGLTGQTTGTGGVSASEPGPHMCNEVVRYLT